MINDFLKDKESLSFDEKVSIYNEISKDLYDFIGLLHPVLNIQLVKVDKVKGNDYNPNKVAPPEMELLALSIRKDGLTMPCVVSNDSDGYLVVDGFHRRTQVANKKDIYDSLNGYLPVSILDKNIEDRITATVRHNMARGTHQVELSAKLITMLKKHNWTNARIGKELGMDAEEVLRLKQITGLAEAFSNHEFSKSWEVDED